MDSRRAEAFSDGVFAIAITLLVLDLRLPGADRHHTLTSQLLHAWPQYFAYVVSFLTIGIMWMNHHTIFAHVTRVDRPLLVHQPAAAHGHGGHPVPDLAGRGAPARPRAARRPR